MSRVIGIGLGAGVAMGTACIIHMRRGIALPPVPPANLLTDMRTQRNEDLPDIILVAENYEAVADLASSITWANVVGIVAETLGNAHPPFELPSVVNIPSVQDIVTDGMMTVVDGDRGVVVADPDGFALAQYQAELNSLAPRTRHFLDDVHMPAYTMDGRTILTLANVTNSEDAELAISNGADIISISTQSNIALQDENELIQHDELLKILDAGAGKPILLLDNYLLPASVLIEASSKTDLILGVVPQMHLEGWGIRELMEELVSAETDVLNDGRLGTMPRLAAIFNEDELEECLEQNRLDYVMQGLVDRDICRVVVKGITPRLLESTAAAANSAGLPLIILTDNAQELTVEDICGSGAFGFSVDPSSIQETKDKIRSLSYSECLEMLIKRLEDEQNVSS